MSQGLKSTFLIHAIVALVFGIVLYVIPGTLLDLVGWKAFDGNMTRAFAAALLALAVSSWFGYRAARWEEVRIVVQMEIAFTVLGAVAGLYGFFVKGAPVLIWVAIVIWVAFAAAWIYFYSRARA
jgi:hypothetical protein